jgi:hypothetical protein
MNPKTAEKLKLGGAVIALIIAGFGFVRYYKSSTPAEGRAYFYDLSAKQLFVAPHSSVPPIRGVAGEEEDGVRAVVYTWDGNCDDPANRQIAYLEMYTPELKRQVEQRKAGTAPVEGSGSIRRGEAHGLILVKRPHEADWHPMTSPAAEQILQFISTPGPDGRSPVVCVP